MFDNIIESYKFIEQEVEAKGKIVNTGKSIFKELVGFHLETKLNFFEGDIEKIKKAYEGKNFYEKWEEESFHYSYLLYGLLQKSRFNKFYFKEEIVGSRKLIIHSEDCISSIQFLVRPSVFNIVVNIRSSDVKELLLVDLFGIQEIVRRFEDENCIKNIRINTNYNMFVNIGSAHIYLENSPRGTV